MTTFTYIEKTGPGWLNVIEWCSKKGYVANRDYNFKSRRGHLTEITFKCSKAANFFALSH